MKVIKTELVYVPKDLCSGESSRMSINDKDTITDLTIPIMIDCLSIVRLPYLNLNVMFCEADCMTIINCTALRTRQGVLEKNPINRKDLVKYITIDEFPHKTVAKSGHCDYKSGEALQYDLTLWKHNIILVNNRFDNLIRGGVYVPACRLYICNCNNIRNRQTCVVVRSSCDITDESVCITIDNYNSGIRNCYQSVYLVLPRGIHDKKTKGEIK